MNEVSVIIACHNMAETLGMAVESALKAGAGDVVIVDDGSSDDSHRIAMGYVGGLVRLRPTPLPFRAGVVFARNWGIQFARHKLIVPLDADDLLEPDGLKRLVEAYQLNTFVYGGWEERDIIYVPPPLSVIDRKNVSHATWLFSKSDWAHVGGYDPLFEPGCEDWAFMCALVSAGVRGIRIEQPIYWRRHGGRRSAACLERAEMLRALLEEQFPKVFHHAEPSHSV